MTAKFRRRRGLGLLLALGLWVGAAGCHCLKGHCPPPPEMPRELAKVMLPDYVIEPPDILQINALRVVPKPPYRVEPLDVLSVNVQGTLPDQPIAGLYTVEPDGVVNLGFGYGTIPVVDLTIPDVKRALEKSLKSSLKEGFQVNVALAQSRAAQQIRGEHLVRPDGSIGLGSYGSVRVTGLTLDQAKAAIEHHLSRYLQKPEISLDVSGFNSKVYYVITDQPGVGEQVIRIPATGNETLLDAISQVNGLPWSASKKHIWISRPVPAGNECDQIIPVDWVAITQRGSTATNYQIFPGDRVYVKAEPLVTLDVRLARIIAPIERVLGVTILGASTVQAVNSVNSQGGRGGGGGFGF